jgi:glycosyltransferase involved in cell wall biosynthesis
MRPLVSAVLPVHNRAGWVARAVSSVLQQRYPAVELIVVDDGSDDGTREVVEGFGSDVTLLSQQRAGPYAARNFAIRLARGELIAFIDSDDVWLPDRLSCQVPLMNRPEVGLVFGDAEHVTGTADKPSRTGLTCFQVTPPARGRVAAHFVWGNFVPTCTALMRRCAFQECGPFTVAGPVSADYVKWFQIARRYELDYVSSPVAEYTVHPDGISYDLERSLRARIGLFASELTETTDPEARVLVRRLLFNLSLHLAWATVRGRADRPGDAFRLAWRTATAAAGSDVAAWTAGFALHHLRSRS